MKQKLILSEVDKKTINIHKDLHLLITDYAQRHDLRIGEATYRLLTISLLSEKGLPPPQF